MQPRTRGTYVDSRFPPDESDTPRHRGVGGSERVHYDPFLTIGSGEGAGIAVSPFRTAGGIIVLVPGVSYTSVGELLNRGVVGIQCEDRPDPCTYDSACLEVHHLFKLSVIQVRHNHSVDVVDLLPYGPCCDMERSKSACALSEKNDGAPRLTGCSHPYRNGGREVHLPPSRSARIWTSEARRPSLEPSPSEGVERILRG